jgi:hypothetical protein
MIPLRLALLLPAAAAAAMSVHAEVIFTETFEYGPGVPNREGIQAGESVKQSLISAGDTPWQGGGGESSNGKMVFGPGRGLSASEGSGDNASIFISIDPKLFSEGSPARVEVEIIPGDAWNTSPNSVCGIWVGFANVAKKGLLANIKAEGDHLALRYLLSRDSSKSKIFVARGVSGEAGSIPGPPLESQVGATYRMALAYNPSDRSFEASITNIESGETQVLSDVLAQTPDFNILRVDITGIDITGATTLPVIKSISLKKE